MMEHQLQQKKLEEALARQKLSIAMERHRQSAGKRPRQARAGAMRSQPHPLPPPTLPMRTRMAAVGTMYSNTMIECFKEMMETALNDYVTAQLDQIVDKVVEGHVNRLLELLLYLFDTGGETPPEEAIASPVKKRKKPTQKKNVNHNGKPDQAAAAADVRMDYGISDKTTQEQVLQNVIDAAIVHTREEAKAREEEAQAVLHRQSQVDKQDGRGVEVDAQHEQAPVAADRHQQMHQQMQPELPGGLDDYMRQEQQQNQQQQQVVEEGLSMPDFFDDNAMSQVFG